MRLLLILTALLIANPAFAQALPEPDLSWVATARVTESPVSNGAYKKYDFRKINLSNRVYRNIDINVDRAGWEIGSWLAADGTVTPNTNILIDGGKCTLIKPTTGGNFPACVNIVNSRGTQPDNVIIRGVEFSGWKMVPTDSYMQGESINADARKTHLWVYDSYAHDNGDAGFDIKSTAVFDRVRSERANYGYRFWGHTRAGTITCGTNWKACIQTTAGTDLVVNKVVLHSTNTKPLLGVNDSGRSIHIEACDIEVPPGTPRAISAGANKYLNDFPITFGPTCAVDAKGFLINTPACTFDQPLRDSNGDGIIELGAVNQAKCGGHPRVRLILPQATTARVAPGQYVYEKAA